MSGNGYITNHDIYKGNISDVSMLEDSIDSHARIFNSKFKSGAADRGFYDEDLIKNLEDGFTGDKIWATLSVMALNIRKLLRDMARSPELIYRFV
jgi:transposase